MTPPKVGFLKPNKVFGAQKSFFRSLKTQKKFFGSLKTQKSFLGP